MNGELRSNEICYRNIKCNQDYCKMLDTLFLEHYKWESGNYYANKIIPKLTKKSNLIAHCKKGYYGYYYQNDSVFNSDLTLWSNYFGCNVRYPY